jgi:hypothetical protein
MNSDQQTIKSLLTTLIAGQVRLTSSIPGEAYEILPATGEQINLFKKRASDKRVPQNVIDQLVDLYKVADNFYYEIVLSFHNCIDQAIFEWWTDKELWLGQRDFYTLRWTNNKFCLGEASTISFSKEHEYETLIGLIEGCLKEIKAADDYDKLDNHD